MRRNPTAPLTAPRLTPVIALACAMGLSACTGGTTVQPAGIGGAASDGQAARLAPGMTETEVFAVFGPESGFERNPQDFDETCLSYAYGDAAAPRHVHARFRGGALVEATDGHGGLCTHEPAPAL